MDGQQALEREKQMIMQLNSGLAQISDVVKQVKAQSEKQLKDLAQSSFEGIQESVGRMNAISDGIKLKQSVLEGTLADLVVKMDTLQDQAIKHARMTNETLAKEVTRIEKVMGTLESFSKLQISELRKDITAVK